MSNRQQRQTQLFVVSVIIGVLALVVLYLGICIIGYTKAAGQFVADAPTAQRQSLPEKCAPYYQDGTDAWINCMGVGYR